MQDKDSFVVITCLAVQSLYYHSHRAYLGYVDILIRLRLSKRLDLLLAGQESTSVVSHFEFQFTS